MGINLAENKTIVHFGSPVGTVFTPATKEEEDSK